MTVTPTIPGNIRVIQEAQYGVAGQVLVYLPQIDGAVASITGDATATIYKPGALPIASSSFKGPYTITQASDGTLSVTTLDCSTSDWTLWWDYTCVWSYIANGRAYSQPQLFDVVRELLLPFCPVNLYDLRGFDPRLDSVINRAGQDADAHKRYILPAWWDVMNLVRANGSRRPALVADAVCLYPATRFRALWYLTMGIHDVPDDRYRQLANDLDKQFKQAWANTKLKYRNFDGTFVNQENAFSQPDLGASPSVQNELVRNRLNPIWTYTP